MSAYTVMGLVALLVALVALTEVLAASVPLLLVITMVPPHERAQLAELIAAADRGRRLRLWPALRAAVAARRCRKERTSP
ncbi:hypothetical protein ACFY36_47380 [Actinoplanes sp. NPDC000266]